MDIGKNMKDIEFLENVRNSRLAVFTPLDISRLIRHSADYVYTYLNRLTKRGLVVRIEKGKYALPETPIESVATNLVYPSYISFLSAFYYHKRTTQIPREITVVSAQSKKPLEYAGYRLRFVRFSPKKILGYERNINGHVWCLGSIEKSIVDSLYLPENCSVADTLIATREGVDEKRLIEFGLKMGSIVTLKRIGYLLGTIGVDVYDVLREHLNGKYDPLDPMLPIKGEKDKTWKLTINMEMEHAH